MDATDIQNYALQQDALLRHNTELMEKIDEIVRLAEEAFKELGGYESRSRAIARAKLTRIVAVGKGGE